MLVKPALRTCLSTCCSLPGLLWHARLLKTYNTTVLQTWRKLDTDINFASNVLYESSNLLVFLSVCLLVTQFRMTQSQPSSPGSHLGGRDGLFHPSLTPIQTPSAFALAQSMFGVGGAFEVDERLVFEHARVCVCVWQRKRECFVLLLFTRMMILWVLSLDKNSSTPWFKHTQVFRSVRQMCVWTYAPLKVLLNHIDKHTGHRQYFRNTHTSTHLKRAKHQDVCRYADTHSFIHQLTDSESVLFRLTHT